MPLDWLCQMNVEARPLRPMPVFILAPSRYGNEQYLLAARQRSGPSGHLDPVHSRQPQIKQRDVRGERLNLLEPVGPSYAVSTT